MDISLGKIATLPALKASILCRLALLMFSFHTLCLVDKLSGQAATARKVLPRHDESRTSPRRSDSLQSLKAENAIRDNPIIQVQGTALALLNAE